MLHILLLILKIIGIVILVILGMLLLVIVGALFVPVRYRIEATRTEGKGQPPVMVSAKVTWFLHFLNVLLRYTGETYVRVRITIVTIYRRPKKQRKERIKKASGKQKKRRKTEEKSDQADMAEKHAACTETVENESRVEAAAISEKDEREEKTEEKDSFRERLHAFFERIRSFMIKVKDLFQNIQYTIRNFCDKIKSIWNDVEFRRELIASERFQSAWMLCKKELGTVLKSIRPQKFEAEFIVGMEDPATTGEILAVCGMLYPFFGSHVDVVGDFERKRLEGRVFMKGKIRCFTLLRVALKLYYNENVKMMYRLLKEGGSANGGE